MARGRCYLAAHIDRAAADDWVRATLNNLGLVVAHAGDLDRGEALLNEALARHRNAGFAQGSRPALRFLGQVELMRGDVERAGVLFRESLDDGWEHTDKWHVVGALEGVAAVAALRKQPEVAAHLLGASEAIRERVGVPVEPAKQAEYEGIVSTIRSALGGAAHARAWQAGRTLMVEQAVDLALGTEQAASDAPLPWKVAGLTPCEWEILQLLADGRSNKEGGEVLSISPRTVGVHLANIFGKLAVHTRTAAVAVVHRWGVG